MKTTLLLVMALAVAARAEDKKLSYDNYKLMKTRNIFDPNRRPIRVEQPREREQRQETRPRSNWIALTGTMVTNERSLAFFNSSLSEARKVASVGDKVGDFKILAITPLQVDWERDGKRSVLAVGRQVDLSAANAEPVESATPATPDSPAPDSPAPPADGAPAPAPTDGAPATTSADGAAAPAPSNDKNEVLRRMMERRQKEMSK